MSTAYSQFVPDEEDGSINESLLLTVMTNVREELSRQTAEDDDPTTNADDVVITTATGIGNMDQSGVWVYGWIEADQTPRDYGVDVLDFPVATMDGSQTDLAEDSRVYREHLIAKENR